MNLICMKDEQRYIWKKNGEEAEIICCNFIIFAVIRIGLVVKLIFGLINRFDPILITMVNFLA